MNWTSDYTKTMHFTTDFVCNLLFSAHISYGKGKYLNQTGFFFFFLQNLPRFYLYLNLRVLPIEFNPHKFSFVRYVFVEIFEVFLKNDENDENVVVEQFGAENIPLLSGRLVLVQTSKALTAETIRYSFRLFNKSVH